MDQDAREVERALAAAAAAGDATAVRDVAALIAAEADAAARRVDPSPGFADEVRQALRVRLLVGSPPRIAAFAGRGPLRGWIGVAALRVALNLRRSTRATVATDILADLASAEPDPALRHMKTLYQSEYRAALEESLASLSDRDRTLLRLVYVDGLKLSALARLYAISEATASRWVAKAAATVADTAKEKLTRKLSVSSETLDQIGAMVRSGLDLSIARLLSP